MIGERLLRSRNAAGLSMQALANQVGLSANMIKKYEHNLCMPSSGNLLKLSKALGVRSEYFFRSNVPELREVEFRKKSTTNAGLIKQVKADVLDQAERWFELANLWPNFPIHPFELPDWVPSMIKRLDDAEALANLVRQRWQLGIGPIADLIDVLESKGILVILSSVPDNKMLDGLHARIGDKPVIVISSQMPGDRQRFTLAHELGHLLMHGRLGDDVAEEKACNRFAGCFLLPSESLKKEVGPQRHNFELAELDFIKHEYGISMQACIYRAFDCGIISESYRMALYKHFSTRGWRIAEPGMPYLPVHTGLFKQLVFRALGEGIIGEAKAAELLKMPFVAFHKARMLEQSNAVIDQ